MAKTIKIIGREKEQKDIALAVSLNRNLLIEGPVGVGKTFLVQEILKSKKIDFVRIDGDTRYTEAKLTGWFDPPLVLKKGYSAETFIEGPLATAMKEGIVLFINELNRMPEAVQNILLPAMDERHIQIPKVGMVKAKEGFIVIATQNPREFTATHALSEALMDRFEMIRLPYQSKDEELEILRSQVGLKDESLLEKTIDIVRTTRSHTAIRRGASVRAAIAVCRLVVGGLSFEDALLMALSSRIELVSAEDDPKKIILDLMTVNGIDVDPEKKKR